MFLGKGGFTDLTEVTDFTTGGNPGRLRAQSRQQHHRWGGLNGRNFLSCCLDSVAEDGPGACWEMECGDGSEFVYEGKREEAVEPPAFSLGCGSSYSYTVAVKRRE